MRKSPSIVGFGLLCTLSICGQVPGPGVVPSPVRAQDGNFKVAERGQNHRVWRGSVEDKLPGGKTRQRTREVVEVASGMYRFDGQSWQETSDQIQLNNAGGGAVANKAAHTATFAPTANGVAALQIATAS